MTLGIPLGLERAERRDQEDVWTWVLQVPCRPVGLYIPIEFAMHATVLGMIAPRCHLLVPGVIPARAFAALGGAKLFSFKEDVFQPGTEISLTLLVEPGHAWVRNPEAALYVEVP